MSKQKHASCSYPQVAPTTHRCSGTSSAFSASANPDEDWTKISDLAERRRIQNRIAQRNYRKKLKKKLEDLERRAASSSTSPEQPPAHLASPRRRESPSRASYPSPEPKESAPDQSRRASPVSQSAHSSAYHAGPEDRGMFSHQHTRQMSTSPPPFSYPTYTVGPVTYPPYSTAAYGPISTPPSEDSLFAPYLSPALSTVANPYHAKHGFYAEDDVGAFNLSYASMAGIEIPHAHSYHDTSAHLRSSPALVDCKPRFSDLGASHQTPLLSESFEQSVAGSPPAPCNFPATPASMPGTPPLLM